MRMPLETSAIGTRESCTGLPDGSIGFYRRKGKRAIDFTVSAVMLVALSPVLLLIAVVVKLTSPGPVLYLQERVGKGAQLFKIVKFRSMVIDADRIGPGITSAGDVRITRIGRVLRKLKLDELPQLWNVLKGEMSLVGPRPELPVYVSSYDLRQKTVLTVCPGITDHASVAFRWEEELLSQSPTPEEFYREVVLPRKLDLNIAYITNMSMAYDLTVILQTASALLSPRSKHSIVK